MSDIFLEIGIVIIAATLGSFVFRLIKQPILPVYILIGLLIGPILKIIPSGVTILNLSEIGIAFLLFVVGLEIETGRLKKGGNIITGAVLTAIVQSVVIFAIGYFVAQSFGFPKIGSFYLGLAVAFSSTMIAVKALSDKRELGTVWGRLSLIILLIQDILALIALIFVSTAANPTFSIFLLVVLKSALLLFLTYLSSKFLFPGLFHVAAKSDELLFTAAIATCFAFAIFSKYLGLTYAFGAFIAGLALANLDFNFEIVAKVKPIRDFFAILFFVSLGILVDPAVMIHYKGLIAALIFLTIIAKPLLIFFCLSFLRFKKDVSFNSAAILAQISEFSIIIAGVGLALSQIDQNSFSIITIVLFVSAIVSVYLFNFHRFFLSRLKKPLQFFERKDHLHLISEIKKLNDHVVVFGYHRTGERIVDTLRQLHEDILVVDFDPDVIEELKRKKVSFLYGDMGDLEILQDAQIERARIVVSTVPDTEDNLLMLKKVNEKNRQSITYVIAKEIEEALLLYEAGADYVIMPHFLGGEHASLLLRKFNGDEASLVEEKEKHISKLRQLLTQKFA